MAPSVLVTVLLSLGPVAGEYPLDGCWRLDARAPDGEARAGELRVRHDGSRAFVIFYWLDDASPTRLPVRLDVEHARIDYADHTEQDRADLTLVGGVERGILVGKGSAADWGPRGTAFRFVARRAGPDLCR